MSDLRFPTALFDWGDTVMKDDPASSTPMVEWPEVHAVEGVAEVLAYLKASGRRCILATSADVSSEAQIRGALARASLDRYFEYIYSFTNTGLPKGEEFYRYILRDLDIKPEETIMVGDGFEKDVWIPNRLGIQAVWFHPGSGENREGERHKTVHSMKELLAFWKSLDGTNGE